MRLLKTQVGRKAKVRVEKHVSNQFLTGPVLSKFKAASVFAFAAPLIALYLSSSIASTADTSRKESIQSEVSSRISNHDCIGAWQIILSGLTSGSPDAAGELLVRIYNQELATPLSKSNGVNYADTLLNMMAVLSLMALTDDGQESAGLAFIRQSLPAENLVPIYLKDAESNGCFGSNPSSICARFANIGRGKEEILLFSESMMLAVSASSDNLCGRF
jgi:hypothetical protein